MYLSKDYALLIIQQIAVGSVEYVLCSDVLITRKSGFWVPTYPKSTPKMDCMQILIS